MKILFVALVISGAMVLVSAEMPVLAQASAPNAEKTEAAKPALPALPVEKKAGDPVPGTATATLKDASPALACKPNEFVGWIVMIVMAVFYLFALRMVLVLTSSGGWNLGDALSEEVNSPAAAAGSSPAPAQLVASSSRFIAFTGSIVLIGIFLATSFYIIWGLFACQQLDRLNQLGTYLAAGSALFAPYAVNKLSEIFKVK